MSTELVLLIGIFAFILGGVFYSDIGPMGTFRTSGPRLGARIERDITIGNRFVSATGSKINWVQGN